MAAGTKKSSGSASNGVPVSRTAAKSAKSGTAPKGAVSTRNIDNEAADALFESVRPMVDGIAATFGKNCEVVLHDYRCREQSVVAVSGNVTGRLVGSPMSQIGLALSRQGDAAEDQLNYVTRTDDDRVIKATTILLRTADKHVVGALCINFDITDVRAIARMAAELSGDAPEATETPTTTFSNDIEAVIENLLIEVQDEIGRPLSRLTPDERVELFRLLDQRGIFQVRKSVPLLAARLGLSRASIYNYIGRVREDSIE